MRLIARTRSFFRHLVHRADLERDMAEELQFHIHRRAEDLRESRGLPPDEALRVARLEFGSIERYKEESRQSVGMRMVDEWRGDLRYAWRVLRHNKGFAAAALATLAIGIGGNTAIFSVLNGLLLRPLPVERPHELLSVLMQRPGREPEDGFTNPFWEVVRDQQDVFSVAFAWSAPKPLQFSHGDVARPAHVLVASGEFFTGLGVTPAAGRLFAAPDDHPGCPGVAVLSDAFWSQQYGRALGVLGNTIALGQQSFQVIGVSRPGFTGVDVGKRFDVAIPLCASALLDKRNIDSGGRQWLSIIGRLKPGITAVQAESRLRLLSPSIMAASRPGTDQSYLARILTTSPASTGTSDFRRVFTEPLRVLLVIVAVVLVLACANVAGLLLARAETRQKEVAIRTALGASRARLSRQLLTEAALLSALGAGLGLLLAQWGSALLLHGLSTTTRPLYLDVSPDVRVLAQTAAVAIAATLMVGLVPARRATRPSVIENMRTRSATAERQSPFQVGRWIVVGQVALSLVLLVVGGLLLRTFANLLTQDVGFDRRNVVVVNARPPWFAADSVKLRPEQKSAIYDELTRRLRTIPGVTSAVRAYTSPVGETNWMTDVRAEAPGSAAEEDATTYVNFVMPGYFATLRTPVLAGRDFGEGDSAEAPRVAVVNHTFARRFFSGRVALGSRFRTGRDPVPIEIVGIVGDAKYGSVRDVTPPTAYLPVAQMPADENAEEFVLRTTVPPTSVIGAVRQVSAEISGDLILSFRTMEERIADDLARERTVATLAGFFGLVGVLLAVIGLYGVLSYLVSQRRGEFGIRMALGAPPKAVMRLVMRDVGVILVAGLTIGIAAAVPGTVMVEGLLFELGGRDLRTIVAATCVVAAAVGLAGYIPARRATRIDPATAIRSE